MNFQMVKELCHRCDKPVYPTDKVGPLKDATFFHQGCFKCYICGTRLALKTYCNNRNNIEDREVYCNNHVPNANPHDLPPQLRSQKNIQNSIHAFISPQNNNNNNTSWNNYNNNNGNGKHSPEMEKHGNNTSKVRPDAGLKDLKIAHAMKATQVLKPYPKIKHEGAKYIVVGEEIFPTFFQHFFKGLRRSDTSRVDAS